MVHHNLHSAIVRITSPQIIVRIVHRWTPNVQTRGHLLQIARLETLIEPESGGAFEVLRHIVDAPNKLCARARHSLIVELRVERTPEAVGQRCGHTLPGGRVEIEVRAAGSARRSTRASGALVEARAIGIVGEDRSGHLV